MSLCVQHLLSESASYAYSYLATSMHTPLHNECIHTGMNSPMTITIRHFPAIWSWLYRFLSPSTVFREYEDADAIAYSSIEFGLIL